MDDRYINYKSKDFLQDDKFIQSIFNPTEETISFWKQKSENHLIDEEEYQKAIYIANAFTIINEEISKKDQLMLWERISESNRFWRKKQRHHLFLKIAAGFLIFLVPLSYVLLKRTLSERTDITQIARQIKPTGNANDIQLFLNDKEKIDVSKQNSSIEYSSQGMVKIDSQVINMDKKNLSSDKEIQMNQLVVPKGKRSTLLLSDGTKLWINAGSRVVYPAKFNSHKREIYVDGEVYLDVKPDKSCPFYVKTGHLNLEVVGTSFNVLAYEQDPTHQIILVRGCVIVDMDNKQSEKLAPNEMLSYTNGKQEIRNVNVEDYILWREGLYNYHSEKLSVIMDRLSRYYGKEILYDSLAAKMKCSGKLDMIEDLEYILDGISKTVPIEVTKENNIYKIRSLDE